jgi:hypothetical protein
MSTTAQEQTGQATTNPPAEATAASTASSPAPAPAAAKSDRQYVLFEEARQDTWTEVGRIEAGSREEALESLGETKLKGQSRFMAIPARFVQPVKPKVTTVTTISFD